MSVKIRNFLDPKRRRANVSPHKREPDVYFKTIWFSKTLYEGFQYIARLEEKSVRETADKLMMWTQRDYIVDVVGEAVGGLFDYLSWVECAVTRYRWIIKRLKTTLEPTPMT